MLKLWVHLVCRIPVPRHVRNLSRQRRYRAAGLQSKLLQVNELQRRAVKSPPIDLPVLVVPHDLERTKGMVHGAWAMLILAIPRSWSKLEDDMHQGNEIDQDQAMTEINNEFLPGTPSQMVIILFHEAPATWSDPQVRLCQRCRQVGLPRCSRW